MKTQIYATFGPSCKDIKTLKKMVENGLCGMRLNLSHLSLPCAKEYIDNYRQAAKEFGTDIHLLIDMQGPELRVGDTEDIVLECGMYYNNIPLPAEVISSIEEGDKVLFDDGKLLCTVTKEKSFYVIRGGLLKAHKSVKVEGKDIKMPCLTEHDIKNIRHAKEYGVTAIMQPFVRDAQDIMNVRAVLRENGAEGLKILAKTENRIAVENLKSIVKEADGIVIARGDLGNDMPLWELPGVQKQIEEACKNANKPYIVVTQMLASMENSPVPTRAEVSDIFHAVYHGAFGVMITGESAIGKYPVEAVKYLAKTAENAEFLRRSKADSDSFINAKTE
ncbi:MAG: pyruvate kinase [Clostridia bacterium]|nr:pyruvate kinase [Clostridia bacterium]